MCQLWEKGKPQLNKNVWFHPTPITDLLWCLQYKMNASQKLPGDIFIWSTKPQGLGMQCFSMMYVLFVWRKAFYIILSRNFSSSSMVSITFVFSFGYCSFPWYGFQDVGAFRDLIIKKGQSLKQLQFSVILGSNQPSLTFGCVFAGVHRNLIKGHWDVAVLLQQRLTHSSPYLENIWGPTAFLSISTISSLFGTILNSHWDHCLINLSPGATV